MSQKAGPQQTLNLGLELLSLQNTEEQASALHKPPSLGHFVIAAWICQDPTLSAWPAMK